MNTKKKIFLGVAILFFLIIGLVSYDIFNRTSFPGSKKLLKEKIMPTEVDPTDSTSQKKSPGELE